MIAHTTDDPEFDAFYARYPLKVAKPAARRAWKSAVKRASVATIMAGLATYKFPTERKFTPHPSTWLNQDRWEGEQFRRKRSWRSDLDGGPPQTRDDD